MASSYPGSLDAFSTAHADGVSEVIHAAAVNDADDAINKIEAELGTLPKGVYTDVKTRLNTLETLVFNTQSGTTYTLVLSDASKVITLTNAGTVTLTVPPNASVAFQVGTQILVRAGSASGTASIAAGAGVTVQSRGSSFTLAGPLAWVTLVQVTNNVWDVFGDLA